MRKLLLLAFMPIACMLANKTMARSYKLIDSVKVAHVTDGDISEWNIEKFETDPVTKIRHSVDHDGENLYVAMKISDPALQAKIMAQGMSMLIDKKGKKKEGSGIEFPLKSSVNGFNRGGGGGSDPKQVREKRASMMIFFKAFGMDNLDGEKLYVISQPGLVNINFGWDEADNMYIEYSVPFIFVGAMPSLNGKTLSVGWKIPDGGGGGTPAGGSSDAPTAVTTTTTRVVAVPAGTTPSQIPTTSSRGGGRGAGAGRGGGSFEPVQESNFKNTFVWTKYVLTF